MDTILWDGEAILPEKIEKFKVFLNNYLSQVDPEAANKKLKYDYDVENDEFLDLFIQSYYHLWSVN